MKHGAWYILIFRMCFELRQCHCQSGFDSDEITVMPVQVLENQVCMNCSSHVIQRLSHTTYAKH